MSRETWWSWWGKWGQEKVSFKMKEITRCLCANGNDPIVGERAIAGEMRDVLY